MAKENESETTEDHLGGKIIAVCSAKGGIGKTLTTVNLAVALSKNNHNVSILDGDFQFGDVSLAMDVQPSFTIKDVIEEIDNMDASDINNFLTTHSSGVKVLPTPDRPEFAELITGDKLATILSLLRQTNDYVVVDNGVGIQEQTVEIIEQSDQILVITNLEMTALKNTKMMLETLDKLGLRNKVRLVINRYNMESLIKPEDVASMLGLDSSIYVPNNFKYASQSINLGIPFVISHSKSDIAKAIFKLAAIITTNGSTDTSTLHTNKKDRTRKWFSKKRKRSDR